MWEVQKWLTKFREIGIKRTWLSFWQLNEIKVGQLVGSDKYGQNEGSPLGNKYYQNKNEVVWG